MHASRYGLLGQTRRGCACPDYVFAREQKQLERVYSSFCFQLQLINVLSSGLPHQNSDFYDYDIKRELLVRRLSIRDLSMHGVHGVV